MKEFLKIYNYQGNWDGKSTWENYWDDSGWENIWKQFLKNLEKEVDKLDRARLYHSPDSENEDGSFMYESEYDFLYHFILDRDVPRSEVVEYSELHEFDKYKMEDLLERKKLEKGEIGNPKIPSLLYYIEPTEKAKDLLSSLCDVQLWYTTKSVQESFHIVDTKSKYGELRVDTSFTNDAIDDLIWELEHISKFTCERCGKQPHTNKTHIIWQSKGYWVEQLCKECATSITYDDRHGEYKDALLTGKAPKNINKKDYFNKCWVRLTDDNKMSIKSYSKEGKKIRSWNPWRSYDNL